MTLGVLLSLAESQLPHLHKKEQTAPWEGFCKESVSQCGWHAPAQGPDTEEESPEALF